MASSLRIEIWTRKRSQASRGVEASDESQRVVGRSPEGWGWSYLVAAEALGFLWTRKAVGGLSGGLNQVVLWIAPLTFSIVEEGLSALAPSKVDCELEVSWVSLALGPHGVRQIRIDEGGLYDELLRLAWLSDQEQVLGSNNSSDPLVLVFVIEDGRILSGGAGERMDLHDEGLGAVGVRDDLA